MNKITLNLMDINLILFQRFLVSLRSFYKLANNIESIRVIKINVEVVISELSPRTNKIHRILYKYMKSKIDKALNGLSF